MYPLNVNDTAAEDTPHGLTVHINHNPSKEK